MSYNLINPDAEAESCQNCEKEVDYELTYCEKLSEIMGRRLYCVLNEDTKSWKKVVKKNNDPARAEETKGEVTEAVRYVLSIF